MIKILQLASDRNPDVQLQFFFISKTIFFFSRSYIMHYVHVHVRILNHFFSLQE